MAVESKGAEGGGAGQAAARAALLGLIGERRFGGAPPRARGEPEMVEARVPLRSGGR